ncbi:hypothetical protein N0V90_008887 [Kalmusia sp. IMI 367209]|nr:hypothetical protein N0V90_008887 [Kalmusia sp. IMI 367209]
MRTFLALTSLLAYYTTAVYATALTYRLEAHERACFFTNVETKGIKVAFYFAVQSGGSFDVDYEVTGPNDKVILDGTKERQGDFVFTANEEGEYRFCFNNEMSTFAEKMVDFEIAVRLPFHPTTIPSTSFFESLAPHELQRWLSNYARSNVSPPPQVENEVRAQLPSKQGSSPEQTSVLEESILKLSAQLSTISRNQKYFRTRENRNFSTVKSTEKRIFNFSMMEVGLMVTMAGLQVFIVRFFFQGARKAMYRQYGSPPAGSPPAAHTPGRRDIRGRLGATVIASSSLASMPDFYVMHERAKSLVRQLENESSLYDQSLSVSDMGGRAVTSMQYANEASEYNGRATSIIRPQHEFERACTEATAFGSSANANNYIPEQFRPGGMYYNAHTSLGTSAIQSQQQASTISSCSPGTLRQTNLHNYQHGYHPTLAYGSNRVGGLAPVAPLYNYDSLSRIWNPSSPLKANSAQESPQPQRSPTPVQDALQLRRAFTPAPVSGYATTTSSIKSNMADPPNAISAPAAFQQQIVNKRLRDPTENQCTTSEPPQKKGILAQTMPSTVPMQPGSYARLDTSAPPQIEFTNKEVSKDGMPPIGFFAPPRLSSFASNRSTSRSSSSSAIAQKDKNSSKDRRPSNAAARKCIKDTNFTLTKAGIHRRNSGIAVHPDHPVNKDSFTLTTSKDQPQQKQNKALLIDLTDTDADTTSHRFNPNSVLINHDPRLQLPPPTNSVPRGSSPCKKSQPYIVKALSSPEGTQTLANILRKKQEEEQLRADEELAHQLAEEEEAQQARTRKRKLRSNSRSPEKGTKQRSTRSLRSSSPKKRDRVVTSIEEADEIYQRTRSRSPEKRTRTYRSRTPDFRTQRSLRSNSPEKRMAPPHHINDEAGEQQRASMPAAKEQRQKATKKGEVELQRVLGKNSKEQMQRNNQVQAQAGNDNMDSIAQQALRAEADRRRMPPPSLIPSKLSRPHSSKKTPSSSASDDAILHKAQHGRITKQSSHRKPPPTDEDLRARAKKQKLEQQAQHIQESNRQRDALRNGVSMHEVERGGVAFAICKHYASEEYRLGHLPGRDPALFKSIVESIEKDDAVADSAFPSASPAYEVEGERFVDLTNTRSESRTASPSNNESRTSKQSQKELAPFFDTQGSTSEVLDINPMAEPTDKDPRHPAAKGLWDFDVSDCTIDEDGMKRAPEPTTWSEERLEVEYLLMRAEEERGLGDIDFY